MVRLPHTSEVVARGKRLGVLLRNARGARSIADVAASAAVSPETLRKIETGRLVTPSFATVAAVAGALGLSLDDLAAQWNAGGAENAAGAERGAA
ncbi:helix-turn-helix domain-containing protein [Microbacterium testaceum]|nr:helix-turn-helix domain-containing protein [Microbacterium testaceum]